jgi:putative ABC transport system permease protein
MASAGEGGIEGLSRDAIYAVRALRRTPGFTTFSVLLLALGIGSSTLVFSIVNGLLLRPLPFSDPAHLVVIGTSSGARLSAAYFSDWRNQAITVADLAGWYDERAAISDVGRPIDVNVDRATTNLFSVLRAEPLLGRTFTSERNLGKVNPEAILSFGFWRRQLAGDAAVIGRTVRIDGRPVTIVGVMPRAFTVRTNELPESQADLWIPFELEAGDRRGMGGALNVIGRLTPTSTVATAHADLSAIARRIEAEYPSYSSDWTVTVTSLREATVENVRSRLLLVFGAVLLLLLIACVSVATLLVSRNAARQQEWAIRTAIGATPARLVRQIVVESAVLAAAGTALGVLIATWGIQVFVANVPTSLGLPRTREMAVDHLVLGFAILLTALTAVICGLLPAWTVARGTPQRALAEAGRSASGSRRSLRVSSALVVSQIAVAVILVTSAGLLGRSFLKLSVIDPGFRPDNVLTFRMTFPESRYDSPDRIRSVLADLVGRLRSEPTVTIGFADYLPMTNSQAADTFEIEGRPASKENLPGSVISTVGGDYFRTLGIPVRRGRVFDRTDTEKTQPVFVIDEQLAEKFWPGADPIDAHVTWRLADGQTVTGPIIGVVGAVRWTGMAQAPSRTTYCWFPQAPTRDISFVVRTTGDLGRTRQLISDTVSALDAEQPLAALRPMASFVADDLAQPRFTASLVSGFAGLAMLMAAIGMYGIMAGRVGRRTREISIRMALGARPSTIAWLVLRDAMSLLAAGLVAGAVLALFATRLISSLLFGVVPTDLPTWGGSIAVVALVGVATVIIPARSATRVTAADMTRTT